MNATPNAPDAVASYVRVSSRAQDHAMQLDAIERQARARGDVIGRRYAERLSGKTLDRPELKRLREDARQGYVRRLYVYRVDRLARSGIADMLTVVQELQASGVEVVTVADGFPLSGPMAELVLAMMAWAAKMERLAINERLAAARTALEARGGKWGRPSRMDDAAREKAVQMARAGRSVREVAVALKVPRSTVARALAAGLGASDLPRGLPRRPGLSQK